jgi:hypothetical protein
MERIVQMTSSLTILLAGLCFGQIPRIPATTSSSIEILLPPGLNSEHFFVRYLVTGEDIGGWIQTRPNVSLYTISTTHEVQTEARIKALLFHPGCAIQIFDLPLSDQGSQQYAFVCEPLPTIQIVGKLVRSDRLYGRALTAKLSSSSQSPKPTSFLETANSICRSRIFRGTRSPGHQITPVSFKYGLAMQPPVESWPR